MYLMRFSDRLASFTVDCKIINRNCAIAVTRGQEFYGVAIPDTNLGKHLHP